MSILPAGLRYLEQLGALRAREIEDALRSVSQETRGLLTQALTRAVAELEEELEAPAASRPAGRARAAGSRRTP